MASAVLEIFKKKETQVVCTFCNTHYLMLLCSCEVHCNLCFAKPISYFLMPFYEIKLIYTQQYLS